MGFFSWDCPACGVSIKSKYDKTHLNQATLVTETEAYCGGYDGYGRIAGLDVFVLAGLRGQLGLYHALGDVFEDYRNLIIDLFYKQILPDDRKIKIYHTSCYNKLDKKGYDDLQESKSADDQGFMNETSRNS